MKYRIRNQQDLLAGLIYIVAGAGFSLGALNYKLGEAARMGPGYFPFWIGILLIAIGVATAAAGLNHAAEEQKVKKVQLGAIAWILGAVVLFGLLLNPAGLVIALAVLIVVSSLASHEFSWKGTILNGIILILFSTMAFIEGINLQIPLWPSFLR